jgi:hypothetical protein
MASVFTAKTLADGTLPNSLGTLYTVPADTKTYVKFFSLFNPNSTQQTVVIYLKKSGSTARRIRRFIFEQNQSADVIEQGGSLQLSEGDVIQGVTTTASVVDYYITGVEETET